MLGTLTTALPMITAQVQHLSKVTPRRWLPCQPSLGPGLGATLLPPPSRWLSCQSSLGPGLGVTPLPSLAPPSTTTQSNKSGPWLSTMLELCIRPASAIADAKTDGKEAGWIMVPGGRLHYLTVPAPNSTPPSHSSSSTHCHRQLAT